MAQNAAQSSRTRSLQPRPTAVHTISNAHCRQQLSLVRRAARAVSLRLCSLLLLVVVALTAPLPGTASVMQAHSGLVPSTLHEHAHDLEEPAAGSAGSATHLRHLLTSGRHHPRAYPKCSKCRYYGTSPSGTFKLGHCWRRKRRGVRRTIHCRKLISSAFVGAAQRTVFRGNATDAEEPLDALFAVGEGDNTVLLRGVACFDDSDCMLRADGFAAVGGTDPESSDGFLAASCLRGGDDAESPGQGTDGEAGVCLCRYSNSTVTVVMDNSTSTTSSSASASTRVTTSMGGRRSGNGASRSLLQRSVSVSTRAVATAEAFEDICVQIPLPDSGEVSDSSLGVVVADSDVTTGRNSTVNVTDVVEEAVVGNSTDGSVELDADFQLAEALFSVQEEEEDDDGEGGDVGMGIARAQVRANATADEFDITIRLQGE
eukprot:jgi/Ulvmu1/8655/UM046_0060.1